MSGARVVLSPSADTTAAIGAAVGQLLWRGDLVALCGALGAGKTQFVKGLARGLGVADDEPVVSPTFVLVREYVGHLPLFHVDAYRLTSADELLALGLDEMRGERGGVVAVEWADRIPDLAAEATIRVDLAHVDETTRELRIEVTDESRRVAATTAIDAIGGGLRQQGTQ